MIVEVRVREFAKNDRGILCRVVARVGDEIDGDRGVGREDDVVEARTQWWASSSAPSQGGCRARERKIRA